MARRSRRRRYGRPHVRIGLVAAPWLPVPPEQYGGTELVVDLLARGLTAKGHDVLVVATGDSRSPVEHTWVYENAQPERMGSVDVELRHVVGAYDVLLEAGVDLVHDHTYAGPLYAARLPDRPVVVTTNHGPFTEEALAIYRAVREQVPLVAISHHQASTADDVPIAAVIHHGIDVAAVRQGPGGDGLVFLARMTPEKGVHVAIEVARDAGLPLRIAAKMREPAEHEYFEACVQPLLGGDIQYVGEVDAHEKVELLGSATALLNPIQWDEPFGLTMVEALACGTPVVVTPRGAAPEIVDDGVTGFVCDSRERLVAAVSEVGGLDRDACRSAAVTRFSMESMVDAYERLFTVLTEPGSGSTSPLRDGRTAEDEC